MRMRITCSSTCSWCVVSALATLSCGSRRIIQVDAAHWWWLRRDSPPPPHMIVKHFGCTAIHNKALYKCIIHSFIHIQNAAARLVFNEPKRAHVTPLFYLLALATCCSHASSSRHWCLHIEQPQSQHPPTSTHYYKSTSSRSLRSASERRLVVPS